MRIIKKSLRYFVWEIKLCVLRDTKAKAQLIEDNEPTYKALFPISPAVIIIFFCLIKKTFS